MCRVLLTAASLLLFLSPLPGQTCAAKVATVVAPSTVAQRRPECFSVPPKAWLMPRHNGLSSAARAALGGRLRAWEGRWHGRVTTVRCLGSSSDPQPEVRRYRVSAHITQAPVSGVFEFDAELNDSEQGTQHRIWYWWLVKGNRLHFGDERGAIHSARRWDVEVIGHVNDGFSFLRQYRVRTRGGTSLARLAVYALHGNGQSLKLYELFYTQGVLTGMRSWHLRNNW